MTAFGSEQTSFPPDGCYLKARTFVSGDVDNAPRRQRKSRRLAYCPASPQSVIVSYRRAEACWPMAF
jgi:hypothetical protein